MSSCRSMADWPPALARRVANGVPANSSPMATAGVEPASGPPDDAGSGPHTQRFGVVRRRELGAGGCSLACDLDLPATGLDETIADTVRVLDVAEPDGAADGVTVGAGGDAAHQRAVPPDRLVVVEQRLRVIEEEDDQASAQWCLALGQERLAPEERHRLVQPQREPEPRLERCVLAAEVMAPRAVGLLDAQRVHRVIPGVSQTQILPRRHQRAVDAR